MSAVSGAGPRPDPDTADSLLRLPVALGGQGDTGIASPAFSLYPASELSEAVERLGRAIRTFPGGS